MKSATTPPYSSASSAASASASAAAAASAYASSSASASFSKVRLQWGGASFGFLGRAKCLNK